MAVSPGLNRRAEQAQCLVLQHDGPQSRAGAKEGQGREQSCRFSGGLDGCSLLTEYTILQILCYLVYMEYGAMRVLTLPLLAQR